MDKGIRTVKINRLATMFILFTASMIWIVSELFDVAPPLGLLAGGFVLGMATTLLINEYSEDSEEKDKDEPSDQSKD